MSLLIYFFAAIGIAVTCLAVALAIFIGLQLTTTDKMQPRKPWWWRF